MNEQRLKTKPFNTKQLTYDRFNRTVDAYARFLVKVTKNAFPEANNKAFVKETVLSIQSRLLVNESEEGAIKEALDRFDLAYKLGSSIREAIIVITRQLANALRAERKFMPKFTFKRRIKRWKGIPLPWIDHVERHDE